MRIAIVGTGYVGLVSGTCLADFGIDVTCVDKDEAKIKRLKNGEVPIYEPGLEDLLEQQIDSGRIRFTTDLRQAVRAADAVFIAVGTPPRSSDGHADLRNIYNAAAMQKAGFHYVSIGRKEVKPEQPVLAKEAALGPR